MDVASCAQICQSQIVAICETNYPEGDSLSDCAIGCGQLSNRSLQAGTQLAQALIKRYGCEKYKDEIIPRRFHFSWDEVTVLALIALGIYLMPEVTIPALKWAR